MRQASRKRAWADQDLGVDGFHAVERFDSGGCKPSIRAKSGVDVFDRCERLRGKNRSDCLDLASETSRPLSGGAVVRLIETPLFGDQDGGR